MEYKVATQEKSTFFNKEAAFGLALGFVAALAIPPVAIGAMTAAVASFVIPLAGAAVAGIVGSIAGKARMNHEETEGKRVKEPSIFNLKAATGGIAGLLGGALAGQLVGAALLLNPVTAPFAAAAFIAGEIGGALLGAFVGGKSGKNQMQREYDAAAQAQAQQDQLQSIALAKQLEQAKNAPAAPLPDDLNQTLKANGADPRPVAEAAAKAQAENPNSKVTVITPDGKKYDIPAQDVAQAQNQAQPQDQAFNNQPLPPNQYQTLPQDQAAQQDYKNPVPVAAGATNPADLPQAASAPDANGSNTIILKDKDQKPIATITITPADPQQQAAVPATAQDAPVVAVQATSAAPTTLGDNSPINIAATEAAPAPAPIVNSPTHNITTNTYTTVITASPQPSQQADATGSTVNNTVLNATETQPQANVVTVADNQIPPAPQTATATANDNQAPAAASPTGTAPQTILVSEPTNGAQASDQPIVIKIAISGDPSIKPVITQEDGSKSFTASLISERQQQQATANAPAPIPTDDGTPKSYTTTITAERQQQTTQSNAV